MERCDPALLSCITADEILTILPFIFVVLGPLIVWLFVRSQLKKHNGPHPDQRPDERERGVEPGEGQSVQMVHQGKGGNHTTNVIMRHTKDPQQHARTMMPAKARKKD